MKNAIRVMTDNPETAEMIREYFKNLIALAAVASFVCGVSVFGLIMQVTH